jgi:hypothetical protein
MNAKIFFEGQIRRTTLESSPTFEELRNKLAKLFNEEAIKDSKLTTIKYADEDSDWIDMSSDEELTDALKWIRTYQQVIRIQITFKPVPETVSKPVSSPSPSVQEEKKESSPISPPSNDIFEEMKKQFLEMSEQFKPLTTQIVNELNSEQPVESLLSLFEKFFTVPKEKSVPEEEKYEDVSEGKPVETQVETEESEVKEEEKPVHFAICDSCRARIRGIRHKCKECRDYDLCETCVVDKEQVHPSHSFQAIEKPVAPVASVCPFVQREADSSKAIHWATCDQCQKRIIGLRFKCEACDDYDLCGECFQVQEEVHPDHEFTIIEKPEYPFRCARRAPATAPVVVEAPVVAEAPVETQVEEKADLGESVPEFVIVSSPQSEEPVETTEAVVEVQEESAPVAEDESSSSDEEYSDEEEEPMVNFVSDSQIQPGMTRETLQASLKQLTDMGFNDREKNIHMIIKNQGDVVATILDLLQ